MTDPDLCPRCEGAGWVLTPGPNRAPRVLELDPCPAAGCLDAGGTVEALAVKGLFRRAVLHPATRRVMSLVGSNTDPADDLDDAAPQGSVHPAARVPQDVGDLTAELRIRARSRRRILPPGARPS